MSWSVAACSRSRVVRLDSTVTATQVVATTMTYAAGAVGTSLIHRAAPKPTEISMVCRQASRRLKKWAAYTASHR